MRRVLLAAIMAMGALFEGSLAAGMPDAGTANVAAGDSRAAQPGLSITTLTWNMCGGNGLDCEDLSPPSIKTDAIIRSIGTHDADVVMLQEMCRAHADQLKRDLGDWHVAFFPFRGNADTSETIRCIKDGNRGAFGAGIMVHDPNGTVHSVGRPLQSPANAAQKVAVCAERPEIDLYACSAHFTNSNDDTGDLFRTQQAHDVVAVQNSARQRGLRTIVGGDLNATPEQSTLDPLYQADTSAKSSSTARGGAPTYRSRKIDYVFFDGSWTTMTGRVIESPYSDHRLLIARTTMR